MSIEAYKNCNVLVTGGAGFIGSHLVEALVTVGAKVTVFDDFSTGSINNLSSVITNITVIGGSITDSQTCIRALKGQEIIFHCAAHTSVPESMENPLLCYSVNVQGTYTLLDAAVKQGARRLVFSSSSAVYGERNGLCSEDLTCNPSSVYGVTKMMGEQLCKNYSSFFNLETVCLRYFNVFGERQNPLGSYAAAVAKFKYNMENNMPIMMFGDGLQSRDFVPVQEVVKANIAVGSLSALKVSGQTFNVASGRSITLLQLVEQLYNEYPHFNEKIIFAPPRPGDIRTIEADCSKLKALLN